MKSGLWRNYYLKPAKKIKFDFYSVDKFASGALLEWQHYWHVRKRNADKLKVIKQYFIEETKRLNKDTIPKRGFGFLMDCDSWDSQTKNWQEFNPELCDVPSRYWRYKFFEVVSVKRIKKDNSCIVSWKVTVVEEKRQ